MGFYREDWYVMKVYWTCTYPGCTHKNETTSHLVNKMHHLHNGSYHELAPFKKEKKKPEPLKKLKAEVWDLFSEYVRRSESIKGFCKCVTCGKIDHWKNMQAGHFIHGTSFLIPELVHPQCPVCNGFGHGVLDRYREWMILKYGEKELARLEFLAKRPHIYSNFELQQYKKMYTKMLKELD